MSVKDINIKTEHIIFSMISSIWKMMIFNALDM